MEKGNAYRKEFNIDRFARHWFCQHARLGQLRSDKKQAQRAARRKGKQEANEEAESYDEV